MPIFCCQILQNKSIQRDNRFKIQVSSENLYKDATLKVDGQNEDSSIMYENKDNIKEVDTRVVIPLISRT